MDKAMSRRQCSEIPMRPRPASCSSSRLARDRQRCRPLFDRSANRRLSSAAIRRAPTYQAHRQRHDGDHAGDTRRALALVRKHGLDPAAVLDILTGPCRRPGPSNLRRQSRRAALRAAGFRLPLALKDMRLALAEAERRRRPNAVGRRGARSDDRRNRPGLRRARLVGTRADRRGRGRIQPTGARTSRPEAPGGQFQKGRSAKWLVHKRISKSIWILPAPAARVSRVALGTWAIGGWMWGGTDEAESIATIRAALDHGINVIDTAPVYGFGRSEEIVGKAIAEGGLRARVLIATKTGLEWNDGKVSATRAARASSRRSSNSLRRLRTDHIDIYQVHWPDPLVPIEETAAAMQTLLRQGKIRAIGVSNFSVAQMERFRKRCANARACSRPTICSSASIEADILPYCRATDRDVRLWRAVPRPALRPHAGGHANSRATICAAPIRNSASRASCQYLAAVERLDQFAQQSFGKRVIHLAIRWMLDQGITTALWGARHPGQLQPVDEVSGWQLDAAAKSEIDRILNATISEPIGPEFMAPPQRPSFGALEAAQQCPDARVS